HIGEMLTGDPISDAELENLARVSPAAFYLVATRALGIMGGSSTDDVLRALPDDLLEEVLCKCRDFLERSNPREPDTWDPEILYDGMAHSRRKERRQCDERRDEPGLV